METKKLKSKRITVCILMVMLLFTILAATVGAWTTKSKDYCDLSPHYINNGQTVYYWFGNYDHLAGVDYGVRDTSYIAMSFTTNAWYKLGALSGSGSILNEYSFNDSGTTYYYASPTSAYRAYCYNYTPLGTIYASWGQLHAWAYH